MNNHQADLVRQSFGLLAPREPEAAAFFFERLFAADPPFRAFLRDDLAMEERRMMTMLSTAVRLLHDPDTLMPTLRILGARLIARGVDEGRYATAAQALMEMLEAMLGDEFTPDVRDAWLAVCVMFSETMKSAADDAVVVG